MARHSNILNYIEIVLTVGNIFSVEFLSFSYPLSLILHIEKGYGFVEDQKQDDLPVSRRMNLQIYLQAGSPENRR